MVGVYSTDQTLTDGTLREREWNGYRTDTEWVQNGNGNACRTETERVLSSVPC